MAYGGSKLLVCMKERVMEAERAIFIVCAMIISQITSWKARFINFLYH